MSHTIRFRRPEQPYGTSKMCVPPEADASAHIRNLVRLGYTILEVSPPIAGYGPTQNQSQAAS
jgi:hypothetical protein